MPFNNNTYLYVNREERFYCALFAHTLLSSASVRESCSKLINARFNVSLDPDRLEVFVEAAALRDYWRDLGDPRTYTDETHRRRLEVLTDALNLLDVPAQVIDDHDFFWTSSARRKLWSPGRWNVQSIKRADLEELLHLKWAFNGKPDLMLAAPAGVMLLEAKVESGEGKDAESGYAQFENQKLIGRLLKELVPVYHDAKFGNGWVVNNGRSDGITWREIAGWCDGGEVDEFTRKAFGRLL